MRYANIILNICILLICGFLYWNTFSFTSSFGSDNIGPAYFPRIILLIIMVTSIMEIIKSFSEKKSSESIIPNKSSVIKISFFVLIIALYILVLGKIPFVIASFVMLFLLSIVLQLRLLPSILISIGLSVTVYLIFSTGFNVIL